VRFIVTVGAETVPVEVIEEGGRYRVRLGEEWVDVDARAPAPGSYSLLIGGSSWVVDVAEERDDLVVTLGSETYRLRVETSGRRGPGGAAGPGRATGQRLVAPMPGKVVAVHVRAGDRIESGAPLVVLEAMKMENEFRAATVGVVAEVAVAPGQAVNAGDLLVAIEPSGE